MKRISRLLLIASFVLATVTWGWAIGGTSLDGTVKNASASMITVSASQDGKMQDVSLEVNAQTKLTGVGSATELKAGDKVKADYKEENGKKIATQISKQGAASGSSSADVPLKIQ